MCGTTSAGNSYNSYAGLQSQRAPSQSISSELAKAAATDMARLMEKQLGYIEGHLDPIALRLFVRAYWSRICALAHTIHDET